MSGGAEQPSPDFPQQDRRCDFTSTRGHKISQREHKLVCELYGRRDNLSLLALVFTSVRFLTVPPHLMGI